MTKLPKKFDLSDASHRFMESKLSKADIKMFSERLKSFTETGTAAQKGLTLKVKKALEKSLAVDPAADLKKLKDRDFVPAHPAEAWTHLLSIADAAQNGEVIQPTDALWLLAALNRTKSLDIERLIRELGFIEMGKPRQHDRFKIRERVLELHDTGLNKMEASRKAAAEIGCSESLAYHYAFRLGKTQRK